MSCVSRCHNTNSDPLLHTSYREYRLADLCTTHSVIHVVSHNDSVNAVTPCLSLSSQLMQPNGLCPVPDEVFHCTSTTPSEMMTATPLFQSPTVDACSRPTNPSVTRTQFQSSLCAEGSFFSSSICFRTRLATQARRTPLVVVVSEPAQSESRYTTYFSGTSCA